MLTSFSALVAVLVFYIVISKKEPNASKMFEMFEMFSRKEDIGFHNMEITPIPRQRLSNGELYREQGRIKYSLASSCYFRVIRVTEIGLFQRD